MGAPQSALNTHAPALILSLRFTDLTIWEVEKVWKQRSVLSRHRLHARFLQLIHLQTGLLFLLCCEVGACREQMWA